MSTAASAPPPSAVLSAFGLAGAALAPLPGGQGRAWRATPPAGGAAVLKPVSGDLEAREVVWLADALSGLPRPLPGLRLAGDLRAASGAVVVDGWRATAHLAGQAGPDGRWSEVLAAATAFTAAVAHLPRPAFLDERVDPWAVADRAAWDEQPLAVPAVTREVEAVLRALAVSVDREARPSQLVHGDLTGNVLVADGLPPGVIDLSPYWRPAAFAGAVVVADGLLWWEQGPELVRAAGESGAVDLVARALLFRLLTDVGLGALDAAQVARYERAARVLRLRGDAAG